MAVFQTKITKARFSVSPFSSEQMLNIGNALLKSVKDRITSGMNANDQPAKPLKGAKKNYVPYERQKIQHGLAPIRDWTKTGRTMRCMKVLSVSQDRGQIGFTDSKSNQIAHINNLRERAFGISPKDLEALRTAVFNTFKSSNVIQFRKTA